MSAFPTPPRLLLVDAREPQDLVVAWLSSASRKRSFRPDRSSQILPALKAEYAVQAKDGANRAADANVAKQAAAVRLP